MLADQLSVGFPALVELQANKSPSSRRDSVGLSLQGGDLCFSVGTDAKMLSFPLHQVQRCHVRMIDSGKLTLEVSPRKQEVVQLFISKAEPAHLRQLLNAMEDAQRQAKVLGERGLPQTESMRLLKERFPDQVQRQLRAKQRAVNQDGPLPIKGHHRVMLTIEAKSMTATQVQFSTPYKLLATPTAHRLPTTRRVSFSERWSSRNLG